MTLPSHLNARKDRLTALCREILAEMPEVMQIGVRHSWFYSEGDSMRFALSGDDLRRLPGRLDILVPHLRPFAKRGPSFEFYAQRDASAMIGRDLGIQELDLLDGAPGATILGSGLIDRAADDPRLQGARFPDLCTRTGAALRDAAPFLAAEGWLVLHPCRGSAFSGHEALAAEAVLDGAPGLRLLTPADRDGSGVVLRRHDRVVAASSFRVIGPQCASDLVAATVLA